MKICYVTDNKAGHAAQARGLFAALERQKKQRQQISLQTLELPYQDCSKLGLFAYWLTAGRLGQLPDAMKNFGQPDVIVVVGHRTHWTGLLLKRCFPQAKLLVLMKPSLPIGWFDLAIIPAHDFKSPPAPLLQRGESPFIKGGFRGILVTSNIFLTQGVLNPVVDEHRHQPGRCLILIGGPSKRHGWDQGQLIQQIQAISAKPYQDIILTTSRRTPASLLQQPAMQQLAGQIQIFPVEHTPQGWLFEQLHQAETVWVTEDSVSMLFEALTAGCKVGMLSMPRLKQDRITSSVDQLLLQRQVGTLDNPPDQVKPLTEADRAATWIINHMKELQS